MTREEITQALLSRADALKAMGATSLFMFGSRARGDSRPDSDLDLFIDYGEGKNVPSYFDLLEIQLRIEHQLGIPVHLGTRASLDPAIRKEAEQDAIRVL